MPLNLRSTDELYTHMQCPFRWRARYFVNLVTLQDAITWAMDMLAITVLRWPVDGREPQWDHIEARLAPVDADRERLLALKHLYQAWLEDILGAETPDDVRPGISGVVRVPGGNCRVPFTVLGFIGGDAVCYATRRTMDAAADYWLPEVLLADALDGGLLGDERPTYGIFLSPTFRVPHATINDRGAAANLPAKDVEKHTDADTLARAIADTGADQGDYLPILGQLPSRWQYLADSRCVELDVELSRWRIARDLRPAAARIGASMRVSKAPRCPGAHCATCPYAVQCATCDLNARMKHWEGCYVLPEKEFTWETWGNAVEALSAQDPG